MVKIIMCFTRSVYIFTAWCDLHIRKCENFKCECIKQMRPSIDVTVLIFIYSQQYATSIRTECYSPMTNELNRTVSSHVIWVPSKLPCSDFCPTTIKPSTVEYCLLNPSSRICYASAITNK